MDIYNGAVIAQCIYLLLPSCSFGFKSQAHHLCFLHFHILYYIYHCVEKRTKINKKGPGSAQIFRSKLFSRFISSLLFQKFLRISLFWCNGQTFFGSIRCSVTRLGDLLDFGQPFKAFGNKQFAQISHILRQFL